MTTTTALAPQQQRIQDRARDVIVRALDARGVAGTTGVYVEVVDGNRIDCDVYDEATGVRIANVRVTVGVL